MKNDISKPNPLSANDKDKDSIPNDAKKLFKAFYDSPKSRRMGATEIGYTDQTFMVTQLVDDWLKIGRAEIFGKIKCDRSGKLVESITTNPKLFKSKRNSQTKLF